MLMHMCSIFCPQDPPLSASFKEGRSVLGGHKLTTRINVLPMVTPAASLEPHIKKIEAKRTDEEGKVFDQVVREGGGYCQTCMFEFAVCRRNQKWTG